LQCSFFVRSIDIVEPVVVQKSNTKVSIMLMLQNIVTKEKKKYEDGDEMINWARCQELEIRFIVYEIMDRHSTIL
jgi:hypothetical protein